MNYRRIVLKLGTGILTSANSINADRINGICSEIAKWLEAGIEVLIVSSGAVGMGMGRLELNQRPSQMPALQKCAAVGQSILTETWQQGFRPHNITVAQVLLTGSDMMQPSHNRIFGDFLDEVIASKIIPVINENDSVSTDGFKLGDNDSLGALVACRINADLLVILSTIPGLMDLKTGKVISLIEKITPEIEALAEDTQSNTSVGGMLTKIRAARLANSSGCDVFIGSGEDPSILRDVIDNKAKGTIFKAPSVSSKSRKRLNKTRWKIHFSPAKGSLTIDAGACEALTKNASSLLATGISGYKGQFKKSEVIDIKNEEGQLIARGISRFSSDDLNKITGKKSEGILEMFPDMQKADVINRDSLILM